jgi:NurA domain
VTLDLGRLSAEIRAMGDHLAASRGLLEARIAGARDLLATADRTKLAAVAEAKRGAVVPVEELTTRVGADPLPDGYQVLATDGSDIEPDRHGPALCYVLNLGWAVIEYGANPHAELGSAPELYYRPEDLYVRDGNRQAPIQGSRLGAKRAVAEMQRLAALCAAGAGGRGKRDGALESEAPPSPIPARVALSDGLLLLGNYWEGPEGFVRDYFVGQFKAALEELRALDVPVAAYISRPRGADVIGLLRLDSRHQEACDWCAGTGRNRADCALEGLADRLLFPDLAPGERSALFESRTLAQHYPPELLPRFFYLNVGREIARVELPVWAAERPALVARVQAVVVDQCRRGQGYPVALARAHEQAVIGGVERQRFEEVVARALVARRLPDHPSEKQASKLARAV